jgi:hypothetical protein
MEVLYRLSYVGTATILSRPCDRGEEKISKDPIDPAGRATHTTPPDQWASPLPGISACADRARGIPW